MIKRYIKTKLFLLLTVIILIIFDYIFILYVVFKNNVAAVKTVITFLNPGRKILTLRSPDRKFF